MATGKASDFTLYDEQYYGGMVEVVTQAVNVFGAQSRGAIQIVPERKKGQYEKETFLKEVSSLISRRDITSVDAATDLKMQTGEFVRVKVDRKVGPVGQTLDAWRKLGKDEKEFSLKLGYQVGKAKLKDYVNTSLTALDAALSGQANLCYDASSNTENTQLIHKHMIHGLQLFGDAADDIVCWVMHSSPYFDLLANSLDSGSLVESIAGLVVRKATVGTLNRPVVLTDSSGLYSGTGSSQTFSILGLTANALSIVESEEELIAFELVTGLENLVYRLQGEYAFNLGIRGFQWDVSNGGATPTDATLGTSSNWDKVASDDKNLAGVRITVTT